ncbi:MFS transporter [Bacillus salitolerans]|uniref:MFS transporter n=1 Tax=Bacillus salitolerans TaxID=1437434 RepID=A0ABW4LXH3_9BACI
MLYARLNRNISKIFLIVGCQSFILAYVIERIFALERGLSILEMQYILIIYSTTSLILEVPFGVLADKWKKKYVLSLGIFFCCFEFFISIYAYSFTVFSLAFLLAAIGGSLKSGIMDSILFETLKGIKRESEFEKFKGYVNLLKYMTSGIAGIVGGYVAYYYGLEYSYWFSLFGLILAALVSLTLYEPVALSNKPTEDEGSKLNSFILHIMTSVKIVRSKPGLFQVMIYGSIIGAILYGQLHEMSSIIYPDIGIPLSHFGYISLTITLFGGLAGVWAYKVREKLGYVTTFGMILGISIISIYLYSEATMWWHVVYLVVAIFMMELVSPLTAGYVHHRIEDQYRVTISSLDSFLINALTILVSLLFGYVAEQWSIYVAYKMMAMILMVYGVFIVMLKIKSRVRGGASSVRQGV